MLRHLHLGERDQRLSECRAVARGAFQHRGGVVEPPGESQVVAQHDRVFRRQLARLFQDAHVGDGEIVLAGRRVGDGAGASRHEEGRIL